MSIIKTDRLELRRFTEADTEPYIELLSNPMVSQYLGSGKNATREGVIRLMGQFEATWDNGHGVFAVVETASGKLIGHCGIWPIADGRIELLYAYGVSAWGKGYATEAGRAVLAYGKENFDVPQLIAMSYPQNKASTNVLKKLGFENIGQEEHYGGIMFEIFELKTWADL